jgi:isopentenyl diphosphate isomerase/L-lactate dehydrogenase-like FMN-dependent dehydrogenase
VCRPFVVAAFGAGEEGIRTLLARFRAELADAMDMCGARSTADIDAGMVWGCENRG